MLQIIDMNVQMVMPLVKRDQSMSNSELTYNHLFKTFTASDIKQISEMPVPTLYQAQAMLSHWNCFYGDYYIKEATLPIGFGYAKALQRCKQIYPELFI